MYATAGWTYHMQIYGFDGNGAMINEQLVFRTYQNDTDSYANVVYNGNSHKTANINIGMGLFNILVQKPQSGKSTAFNLTDGYYIGNFKLSGKVEVKEYNKDNGKEVSGAFSDQNNSPARDRYAVGGLTGGILPSGYVNLFDLDLDSLIISLL